MKLLCIIACNGIEECNHIVCDQCDALLIDRFTEAGYRKWCSINCMIALIDSAMKQVPLDETTNDFIRMYFMIYVKRSRRNL